ncbi:AraC family transcriptional regulator [Stutzerimonas balearica]|jgi:transcriptional regulator GlxA family with amidase domain|uniref:DJ-1/PfpI family protein n=1 Tax=Stutzerimonas balearica TaxID=74829 RepID=A0A9X7YRE9_9GAMM|nr:DJ-1/PfpI family protein [Stutzerimonas balearica]MBC7198836.1 DJ-1/PfpI family protein [Stutzerimonas balearica]MBS4150372.1 helix-turn-helix domain-containing protein [Stutzerimonas balearica]MCZ4127954.1 DJ-1/PfpI family protein [Stutzerimonas balearica]OMG69183.1 AraC family transcriptional regulator [Stutzerimonas balearica]QQN51413.1 DJ-1/PfpI family protein [Stutzerimonas balearica]
MSTQRKIACLVFPDVMSLDVTGPVQVFASANVELQRQGRAAVYQPLLLGESLEPVASSCGIRLGVDACWHGLAPAELDTLLVPGGQGVDVQRQNPALLAWLRRAEGEVRRLGSVCSGALLLAEAGLLQGHRATTHWADVPSLQRFADVEVQGDRLHTFDPEDAQASHLFTSAGVTAGIDLALALVEADLGRPLALAVAQRLVMFLRRPGGQAQFSPLLTPSAGRVQRLARLLEWIPAHLADDLSIEALAFQAHMTPRTLCRLFKQEVGMGPGRYVEQVRLEAARNLLLDGQASVATTARLTGFGHPENLRRTFQKRLSVSPSELAERFG